MKDQFNRNYCSCKYYVPCGLCTYYDKPCREVCGKGKKPSQKNDDVIIPFLVTDKNGHIIGTKYV